MSEDVKSGIARRPLLAAVLAAMGLAAAGGGAYEGGLFGRHYPRTPYDDLLNRLADRARAQTIGKAAVAGGSGANTAAIAADLRRRLGDKPLAAALANDIADNAITEVDGWVLPMTFVELCELAAVAG